MKKHMFWRCKDPSLAEEREIATLHALMKKMGWDGQPYTCVRRDDLQGEPYQCSFEVVKTKNRQRHKPWPRKTTLAEYQAMQKKERGSADE